MMERKKIEEMLLDKNGNPSRLKKIQNAGFLSALLEAFPHDDVNTAIWLSYSGNVCRTCRMCSKPLKITNFKIGFKDTQNWCSIACRDSDPSFIQSLSKAIRSVDMDARAAKIKSTCLERYGVDHPSKHKPTMDRIQEARSASIPSMIEKSRQTCLERYGVETYFESNDFLNRTLPRHSKAQEKLAAFIQSLGFTTRTDRTIIGPKEIDVVVDGTNIGFEVNGVYWHSSGNREEDITARTRHVNKSIECRDKGFRLIHLTDVEINKKWTIVESMVRSVLGRSGRLMARKGKVVEVDSASARRFFDATHIQGFAPCGLYYGLEIDGNLLCLMGFNKARFDKRYDWELVRFSSALNTTVVGGFES